jgi:hypothetical protein
MFEDLRDSISILWSWRWPAATGSVTAVDVERIKHQRGGDTFQLAVAYKFSVGDDGPYTGEGFWQPSFFSFKRVSAARHNVRIGHWLTVRYRPDDPSVNKPDAGFWKSLSS